MFFDTSKLSNNQTYTFDKVELKLDEARFETYFAKPTSCLMSGYIKKDGYDIILRLKIFSKFLGVCYKCGNDAAFEINLDLNEVVEPQATYLNGKEIDITEFVTSELILNFPSLVVCKQTCLGLCGLCGKNLNEGLCNCNELKDIYNPQNPFSELKKLLNNK